MGVCPDCGETWQLGDELHRGDCPRLRALHDFRNPPPEVVEERREQYLELFRSRETDRGASEVRVRKVSGSGAVQEGDK